MVHAAAAVVSAVPSGLDPRKDCAEDSARYNRRDPEICRIRGKGNEEIETKVSCGCWNSLACRFDSCAPAHSTSRFSHLCRAPPGGSIHSLLPS